MPVTLDLGWAIFWRWEGAAKILVSSQLFYGGGAGSRIEVGCRRELRIGDWAREKVKGLRSLGKGRDCDVGQGIGVHAPGGSMSPGEDCSLSKGCRRGYRVWEGARVLEGEWSRQEVLTQVAPGQPHSQASFPACQQPSAGCFRWRSVLQGGRLHVLLPPWQNLSAPIGWKPGAGPQAGLKGLEG